MLKFPNNQNPTSNQLEGAANISPPSPKIPAPPPIANELSRRCHAQSETPDSMRARPFSKHTQLRQRLDQGLPRKFRNTPLPSEAPGKNTPFAKPTRNCSHRNSQQYPCIHVHTHTLFKDTSKENTRKKQFFFCYRLKKSNPFDMGR